MSSTQLAVIISLLSQRAKLSYNGGTYCKLDGHQFLYSQVVLARHILRSMKAKEKSPDA